MNQTLEISEIELDPELQPRAVMDEATIEEYTEVLRDEVRVLPWPFPPVSVVHDGEKYWLWDGFHRVQAAKNAGISRIPATIQQGDRAFALWRSVGANKTHGLRRSNADKRRATELALLTAPDRSDRELAFHVGVSHPMVAKIRAELDLTGKISSQIVRTGADGRTINTANIGGQHKATGSVASPAGEPVVTFENQPGLGIVASTVVSAGQLLAGIAAALEAEPDDEGPIGPTLLGYVQEDDAFDLAELERLEAEERAAVDSQFDCPQCDYEKVVHVNGGAWCLNCGVRWASAASFKLDLKNYEAQLEHVRNLRALVTAAGGPETARQVLEMKEQEDLIVAANSLFWRIVQAESRVGLKELIVLLEDFEMDRPKGEGLHPELVEAAS